MSLWGKFFCALNDFSFLNIESNNLIYNLIVPVFSNHTLFSAKLRSRQRIGPHDSELISIIFGSLLGDGYAEKHGNGTRICFQQEESHSSYLFYLHEKISEKGYCNETKPKITTRIGKKGKLRYLSRFKTYTYSSFNWIRDIFYFEDKKIVPKNISDYLSPLALAIWIQDDGGKASSGLKICTNSFTYEEVKFLAEVLKDKYGFKVTVNKAGALNQYVLYFSKNSMGDLAKVVKPYMHPSMYYKLNGYI